MQSRIPGPMVVVFGHGHTSGTAVGPDFPDDSCLSWIWWCACCCSHPHGWLVAHAKTAFNESIKPRPGRGVAAPVDALSYL